MDLVRAAHAIQTFAWPQGMMAAFLLFVRQTTQARSKVISSVTDTVLCCASRPAGCVAPCTAIRRLAVALVMTGEGGGKGGRAVGAGPLVAEGGAGGRCSSLRAAALVTAGEGGGKGGRAVQEGAVRPHLKNLLFLSLPLPHCHFLTPSLSQVPHQGQDQAPLKGQDGRCP